MTLCRRWIPFAALLVSCAAGCGRQANAPEPPSASAKPVEPPWVLAFDFRQERKPAAQPQVLPAVLDAEARIPGCGDDSAGSPVVDDVIDGDFLGTGKPVQAVLVNRHKTIGEPGASGSEEIRSALVLHDAGKVVFAVRVPDTQSFGGVFPIARAKGSKLGIVMIEGEAGGGECYETARLVELGDNGLIELRKVDRVLNCTASAEGCRRPKGRLVEIRVENDHPDFRETPVPWGPGNPCAGSSAAPIPSGGPPPPPHS